MLKKTPAILLLSLAFTTGSAFAQWPTFIGINPSCPNMSDGRIEITYTRYDTSMYTFIIEEQLTGTIDTIYDTSNFVVFINLAPGTYDILGIGRYFPNGYISDRVTLSDPTGIASAGVDLATSAGIPIQLRGLVPGTGTYSYIWSNGSTGQQPVVTAPSTTTDYCVTITELSQGCTLTDCMTLTIGGNHQYVAIPDANFRTYLQGILPNTSNALGQIDILSSDVLNLSDINCDGLNIANLDGIQYFTNLTTLYCQNNQLTTLPNLPNTIQRLSCGSNQLVNLTNLPSGLTSLFCQNNSLSNLSNLPTALNFLDCSDNLLTTLPNLSSPLFSLKCSNNRLTALPTSLPSQLGTLHCSNNQLAALPSSLPASIHDLDCNGNQLSVLPPLPTQILWLNCSNNNLTALPALNSTNLNSLNCSHNLLTTLPILNSTLYTLDCSHNQLVTLPTLQSLLYIYCNDNQLTALPQLPNYLKQLTCGGNALTTLPQLPNSLERLNVDNSTSLSCLPLLPIRLVYLSANNTLVSCLPNLPTYLANPSLPICASTSQICNVSAWVSGMCSST